MRRLILVLGITLCACASEPPSFGSLWEGGRCAIYGLEDGQLAYVLVTDSEVELMPPVNGEVYPMQGSAFRVVRSAARRANGFALQFDEQKGEILIDGLTYMASDGQVFCFILDAELPLAVSQVAYPLRGKDPLHSVRSVMKSQAVEEVLASLRSE